VDPAGTDDLEIELVLSAMRLVAAGVTARTVVAGLRGPEDALALAGDAARELGVIVEPLPRAAGPGIDIAVRRHPRETRAAPERTTSQTESGRSGWAGWYERVPQSTAWWGRGALIHSVSKRAGPYL